MSKTYNAEEIVLDFNDSDVKESFSSGVMPDKFNYSTLVGGLVFIVVLILGMIGGVSELFNYYRYQVNLETQLNLKYVEKETLLSASRTRLSTTGTVDKAAGVYHIPVEKAMELLVSGSK
jgi:hypothetical protein